MKKLQQLFFALVLIGGNTACSNQFLMLHSLEGDPVKLVQLDTAFQHYIRPDDKLSLSIWNHDNLSLGSVFSIYNSNEAFGKWVLVDQQGYAQLPKVGAVKLAGLSCSEAADTLGELFSSHINHPIIVVKVLNRAVTVLGEVRTPGNYVLEEEQVNLLELIGKAQGFTDYADLRKLRLIRKDLCYSLDLKQMDSYLLSRILLESGDLIVVSPRKGKALDQKAPTLIPFASVLTSIAVVVSIIL